MAIATAALKKHLTDIAEWPRLGDAGIFPPDSRLELINGEIIEMSPIGSNHAGHLKRLNRLFNNLLEDEAVISIQDPLQLSDYSEPEPDFMLLKPREDFYSSRHPVADDVLLLIEVADSSLEYDRTYKLQLYATHNIQEYWLLNLNESCLEVYRRPHGDSFEEKNTLRSGDNVGLTLPPEITLQVDDLL